MRDVDDCPKCDGPKDARAKQCYKCRRKEWEESRITALDKRYNLCVCGNNKDKRSELCLKCRRKKSSTKSIICKCGRHKNYRSAMCIDCFRLEHNAILPNGNKVCSACNKDYPINDFHNTKSTKNGKRSICKLCSRKAQRHSDILRRCIKMGLNQDISKIIAAMDVVVCEICGEPTENRTFHIDHCHVTGQFRGLLCANCNSGIGLLNDDIERLRKAIEYLETPYEQRWSSYPTAGLPSAYSLEQKDRVVFL